MPKPPAGEYQTLPLLPLRDVVIFPGMMMPFVVGREKSVAALERAVEGGKKIFLSAQRDAETDDPDTNDIYSLGTVSTIVQSLKLPNGNIKVLVEGNQRARVIEYTDEGDFLEVVVKPLETEEFEEEEQGPSKAKTKELIKLFEKYVKLSANLPNEAVLAAVRKEDPGRLADTIAAHLSVDVRTKQDLLEIVDVESRLDKLVEAVTFELDKLRVDKKIQGQVKKQMEQAQKEYYLNEKMKAIQRELGREKGKESEVEELRSKIAEARMPEAVQEKAEQELERLEAMPPMSAESTVSRNYIEWLVSVPWFRRTRENNDLKHAAQILDDDHYGLDKIKDRIVEFLAVRMMVENMQGSILCFVGAPGTGKSSLARSIARATGREFIRLSLGGVRDEAEIRGHRRTYIGAFPGQIMQRMKQAGVVNPLFLLDEVDKMSADFRGDPSAALMEVLDPEQNHSFVDHYLDVEYDLSRVMFICTANVLHTIPAPLQDRMEVIQLSGYTQHEKMEIARRHLLPKQLVQHGLKEDQLKLTDPALGRLIEEYTREAGVRNLERQIARVCRKGVRNLVEEYSDEIAEVATELTEAGEEAPSEPQSTPGNGARRRGPTVDGPSPTPQRAKGGPDETAEGAGPSEATEASEAAEAAEAAANGGDSGSTASDNGDDEPRPEVVEARDPMKRSMPSRTELANAIPGDAVLEVDVDDLEDYLGVPRYKKKIKEEKAEVGLAAGLAWTERGGEVLAAEATLMPGKGKLSLTGKLGDIMQESGQAALSWVRSQATRLGLEKDFHKKLDIHVHVPEGAIPKDGPSAGITLATAIASSLTGIPVSNEIAMTGEITLRGKVLNIGGVKEKVLAAHRAGIHTVILPSANEKDLKDIPDDVREDLTIHLVDDMDEVLRIALVSPLTPVSDDDTGGGIPKGKGSEEQDIQPPMTH